MENAPGASQIKTCIASCNTLRDYYLCCMSASMTLLQKYHKLNSQTRLSVIQYQSVADTHPGSNVTTSFLRY